MGRAAPARGRAALLTALAVLGVLVVAGGRAEAQPLPRYDLRVQVELAAHTIRGTLTVTLAAADPRAAGPLWFHLPPNRFLAEDPRGTRRHVDSLNFATGFSATQETFDAMWPGGFDPGRIDIEAVETGDGRPLVHTLADNPQIPTGYSVRDGLLRVAGGGGAGARVVRIRFVTHLPERYRDGWSEAGLLLEQWYPILANRGTTGWDFDPFAPRGGRYAAEVTVSDAGRLFLGHGWTARTEPGEPLRMGPDPRPLRVFPLVFVARVPVAVQHDYEVSIFSYHQRGNARLGELAVEAAARFLAYARRVYRLNPPNTRITIVQVAAPPGDIRTLGSLVLVPEVYYKNSRLLDRVFVAQLSRAVAQVWFGETVWSNRDTQTWLHLGLAGYLALDFFHSLYGWDAGIHNVMDWLQPRYREHFFEAPVRGLIRSERDAPLAISLRGYPQGRTARIVAHNKAPLVLRSLTYLVGQQAFARGLNALYGRHRYTAVTEDTLRRELAAQSGLELGPFFAAWFHDTPQVDFAVEGLAQERSLLGHRVRVQVRRTGPAQLPVDVAVATEDGERYVQRWDAGAERAELMFVLPTPAAGAVIDPDEHWLEANRKDNYSDARFRLRPLFDWPKQREVLVALRGTAGSNSTDGNYIGLGVNVTLNEENSVRLIPIYGERTGLSNYEVQWAWQHVLLPPLDFDLILRKLGGTTLQSLELTYRLVDTDTHRLFPTLEVAAETVNPAGFRDRDGAFVSQEEGRANRVGVGLVHAYDPGGAYSSDVSMDVKHSQPSYPSDFEYTGYELSISQQLALGSSHLLRLDLARGGHTGSPPLQKRFDIGGPGGVSGYPLLLELSNEEVALAGLEYGYVVSRQIVGAAAQLRRTTVFIFADGGRGWNNDEHHDTRPQRQSAGLGIELLINLLRLAEFPLRVDVAYPYNDDEYRDPQIILFGLLTF